MTDTLTQLEAEIQAAGHKLERTYEGGPIEGRWLVHVDGELAATGASAGRVEAALREWWERTLPPQPPDSRHTA